MAIVVRVLDAYLTHDTELFSKMDPYVVLTYAGERRRTATCQSANRTPFWGETVMFTRTAFPNLKVEIWDRETWMPDDLVGEGVLNLAPILMSPPGIQTVQTIHLFYQGRSSGTLNIAVVVQGQLANTGPVGYTYQLWSYESQLDPFQNRGVQPGWGIGW